MQSHIGFRDFEQYIRIIKWQLSGKKTYLKILQSAFKACNHTLPFDISFGQANLARYLLIRIYVSFQFLAIAERFQYLLFVIGRLWSG